MNEELKALLAAIKNKKDEVRALANSGKLEEAKAAKVQLQELSDKFDLLVDLEDEKLEGIKAQAADGTVKKIVDQTKKIANTFVNAIRAGLGKYKLSEDEMEIVDSMNEGSQEDGGLTVPQDIRTQIKELRRAEDALETHVNVERVGTLTGSRVIERHADQTPFDNVDEEEEFPDESTPQFENIEYKVKKKGGILKITYELLQDSAENILGYLRKWIAKKAKATRNFMIVKMIRDITADTKVLVDDLDGLKRVFNIILDPAIAINSKIITNQDGFNWLDTLKTNDGKYALQPDPTDKTKMLLFGKYPIVVVGNKTLKSRIVTGGFQVPLVCGDFKEAITIFDRETLTIDISSTAGELWKKDQTGIKVRERLDIRCVDPDAIVMAEHFIKVDEDGDGKYSANELEKLTKAKIFEIAAAAGYTMTTTEADSKPDIIADFLAKQG